MTAHGRPVAAVIDDHLAPRLLGEDCLAVERLADMMFRLTKPYGSTGLASYAVSAVDLALWDLRGKLLGQPAYRLLGGPTRERIFCYCTGNDVDWYQERYPNRPYIADRAPADGWAFRGTGFTHGTRFGHYGIEVDQRTSASPAGLQVLARIPDIFGHGKSAEMAYYRTRAGAKVFAAGVINFGGSALWPGVTELLGNVWDELARP